MMREDIEKIVERTAERSGQLIKFKAKALAPWKTGDLFRSIDVKTEKRGDAWVIVLGATVPYASYQERGTRKLKAGTAKNPYKYKSGLSRQATRPFLATAVFRSKPDVERILREEMRK